MLAIVKLWWAAVLWMAIIFALSTDFFAGSNTSSLLQPLLAALFPQLSAEHLEIIHYSFRKFGHWLGYFILGLLIMRSMRGQFPLWHTRRQAGYVLALTILYATTDEWHQSFVPSRSASIFDVLLDSFGAFCGIQCFLTSLHNTKKLDKLRVNREDINDPQ